MKRFLCADIVPGCGAQVRARSVGDTVAGATEHLVEAHGRTAGDELTAEITAHLHSEGWLAALRR